MGYLVIWNCFKHQRLLFFQVFHCPRANVGATHLILITGIYLIFPKGNWKLGKFWSQIRAHSFLPPLKLGEGGISFFEIWTEGGHEKIAQK